MILDKLGVVIVTFDSSDVIIDCLESLVASEAVKLCLVVVDNASTDGTVAIIEEWAKNRLSGRREQNYSSDITYDSIGNVSAFELRGHTVTILRSRTNRGFAAGVNQGLAVLAKRPEIDRFWILNPDSIVQSGTPFAFASEPIPSVGYSLMGGRVVYLGDESNTIQIDGGRVNWLTGVTRNANQYLPASTTPPPDPATLDFITGASMVVSRAFYESAGPMPEDYFLYYEEVDWAMRRGALPLVYCKDAVVYHHGGTAIGSPTMARMASPFSLYFKHRGRMRFIRRFRRRSVLTAYAYGIAKAGQLALKGGWTEAYCVLAGSFNWRAPKVVRERLSPEAAALAFRD
jgi:GT2 family glycosyltransferase